MAERHLEQVLASVAGQERRPDPRRLLRLDTVRRKHVCNKVAITLRDAAGQFRSRQLLALAFELGRHDEVDAVGLPADMVVDPRQLLVELLGRKRRRAQHAEPARVGHRRHDVAAMAKREEREIDTELLTDGWLHTTSIQRVWPGADGYAFTHEGRRTYLCYSQELESR